MDTLKLKDLVMELVEELKIARITLVENEGRIQQLVEECHYKERKLEEEAVKTQSLKEKHEEAEAILSKASDDKITHLEAEKTKLHLAVDNWEKEMKILKEEIRTLQLSKYNLERTVREQHHRLQTQGQSKASHSQQVAEMESRCKHLQKEMSSYSDSLNLLRKEVAEAGVLNRMLSSTNSHQKCQIESLKDEVDRGQKEIIKLHVQVTEIPNSTSNEKEKSELKIEQLNKEVKQVKQINKDLKTQLEETKTAHMMTQAQLEESQDLAKRWMKTTNELTQRAAKQEDQVAALTKECAVLSERHKQAGTDMTYLQEEIKNMQEKNKSNALALEEEMGKAKNECNNLKKTVLNLEDINTSWAIKNQTMIKDLQQLKLDLEDKTSEIEKLRSPSDKLSKDTQTDQSSHSNDDDPGCNKTGLDKSLLDQVGDELKGEISDDPNREELPTSNGLPEGKLGLCLNEKSSSELTVDTTNASPKKMKMDISKDEPGTMGVQCAEEPSTDMSRNKVIASRDSDLPGEPMEFKPIQGCQDGGGNTFTKESGTQVEDSSQHQHQNITDVEHLPSPKPTTDGLCTLTRHNVLEPEKDENECDLGEDSEKLESTSTQPTLKRSIPDEPNGDLEALDKENPYNTMKGSISSVQQEHELYHNQASDCSSCNDSKEIHDKVEKIITPVMTMDNKPDVSISPCGEVESNLVPGTSVVNQDQVEMNDEDIIIPSTYAEENSSRSREKQAKNHECDIEKLPNVSSKSKIDLCPKSSGNTYKEVDLLDGAGNKVGRKINTKEVIKTIPVLLSSAEISPQTFSASENPAPSSDMESLRDTNMSENSSQIIMVCKETVGKETKLQDKKETTEIRSSMNKEDSVIKPTNILGGLDNYSSTMRREQLTSPTKGPVFLETPKRKYTPSSQHATNASAVPQPNLAIPAITTNYSYLTSSEPLPSAGNTNNLQRNSFDDTKFVLSSPTKRQSKDAGSASTNYLQKTLDDKAPSQQQQNKQIMRTPMMFFQGLSSAQQLHQSLHPNATLSSTTPPHSASASPSVIVHSSTESSRFLGLSQESIHKTSITLAKEISDHPSSVSPSSMPQSSTESSRQYGISQETIPKSSTTMAKEIQELVPRLTRGRSLEANSNSGKKRMASTELAFAKAMSGDPQNPSTTSVYKSVPVQLKCWLPPVVEPDPGGAGDAGGEASLFSDDDENAPEEDMKDGVASQIDRIQIFLKKDRLKRAKLE